MSRVWPFVGIIVKDRQSVQLNIRDVGAKGAVLSGIQVAGLRLKPSPRDQPYPISVQRAWVLGTHQQV